MASPQITAHTEWCGEPFVQVEFFYFAHVFGNWAELVLVPPPPSSGQRALLNTPKTGKKCHIVWDRPLMINRRGNQFNFISSRSLGYPTGFYFPSEEEISSGSLEFMISILPRPPATRQVPTARDKGESIGLYISTWTEFSRIKSDKHGWTTKKKWNLIQIAISKATYALYTVFF